MIARRGLLRRALGALLAAAAAGANAVAPSAPPAVERLDDFHDAGAWRASASDQVQSRLQRDADGSLCLAYDFAGVSGYAVMRRELPRRWPADFALTLRLRGDGPANDLQIKFVDAGGDNVWWIARPRQPLPARFTEMRFLRRHVDFAWGPATDHAFTQTRYLEFVIAAAPGAGGHGRLCLQSLALSVRAPAPATWPAPTARAQGTATLFDLHGRREFNGLALAWPAGTVAPDVDVDARGDDGRWQTLRRVRHTPAAGPVAGIGTGTGDGAAALPQMLFLPESEARALRVKPLHGSLRPTLRLFSAAEWPNANALRAAQAALLPRGALPRAFRGEQNYWTLAGVDGGGARSALVSEDGAIEIGRGGCSVEPVVRVDGGPPQTWGDAAAIAQDLPAGALPLPQVHWRHPQFALDMVAAADGPATAPTLLARYRLRNTDAQPHRYTLALLLRPWQVNPPQQFLTTPGGVRPVATLQWQAGRLAVDGVPLQPVPAPQRVTALAFDDGPAPAPLLAAPVLSLLQDPQRQASAALQFDFTLAPDGQRDIGWAAAATAGQPLAPAATAEALEARIVAAADGWRARLAPVRVEVPPSAQALADTLHTALAHILQSRDGAALRPGTRAYARSWIRDGAMMVAALVRLGEIDAARDFVDAFALRIFASGKVPCCVDDRGADPVVENDSHGQYLFAVAEVWRHGHDARWLAGHWATVQRVVAHLEQLRQSERGPANLAPERRHLFGLLPPSISHEGYSDKPAYSYWDDFWALRGFKDAVRIAEALGHADEAAAWAQQRDGFARELSASIAATARWHHIDHIAGAADRGDFDATSTTVALSPAEADLPRALLEATFERYWQEADARAQGRRPWKDYTPYELRTVGALVRLGQAERAQAMLRFFFADQRPAGWRQWAEVVLPDAREPHFLGDMPHAWVASDFLRSALDLFAYEREADASLVIGAGFTPDWRAAPLGVHGLSTAAGRFGYTLRPQPEGWRLEIDADAALPAGGLRLAWPGEGPLPQARQAGRALAWQGRELPLADATAVQLTTPRSTRSSE